MRFISKINETTVGYAFGLVCFWVAVGLFIHFLAGAGSTGRIVLFIFMGVVCVLLAKGVALLKNANIYLQEHSSVLKSMREKIK